MRTAYFSEFSTPGHTRIVRAFEQLTAIQRAKLDAQQPPQNWDAILARQQAIYDELVASHELAGARRRAAYFRRPTARELTRDLAGWTRPAPGPTCSAVISPGFF